MNFVISSSRKYLLLLSIACLQLPSLKASTIYLSVGYLDRNSDLTTGGVVLQELSGPAANMVGQQVGLERGIHPLSGNLEPTTPNFYTKVMASASGTRLKIYNESSLWYMPTGTFPQPANPNSYSLANRTDSTGYAQASLYDTLTISDGSGEGTLHMSFRISGTGSNPGGLARINASVCPQVSGQNSCYPWGVSVTSNFQSYDQVFDYAFPFIYGVPFDLYVPFYSWIFINEPAFPGHYYAGGALDAFHSLEFKIDEITDLSNVVNPNAKVAATSGFDYFREFGDESDVPEPNTMVLVSTALAIGFAVRRLRPKH